MKGEKNSNVNYAFRCTRVFGIHDSRELELVRKEFARHPLHMTNRLLFARLSRQAQE